MKPRLILHIGGGKCGSSSLQTFLTQNARLEIAGGRKIEYWTAAHENDANGKFVFMPVERQLSTKGLRYKASDDFRSLLQQSCLHEIFHGLMTKAPVHQEKDFVLSCEGWSREFQKADFFKCQCKNAEFEIIVFLFVRPQIDMLIPAFLQWTLWANMGTMDETFELLKNIADWPRQIENAYLMGADNVIVSHTSDIVEKFCTTFNICKESTVTGLNQRINKSLPIEVVSFLRRHRELRANEHEMFFEFYIEALLDETETVIDKSVLRIDPNLVKAINDYFYESNCKIQSILPLGESIDYSRRSKSSTELLLDLEKGKDLDTEQMSPRLLEDLFAVALVDIKKLVLERDELAEKLRAVQESKTWKLLEWYRKLKKRIRSI